MGRHGGPHDGLTLIEIGLDERATRRSGRVFIHSGGNYRSARSHTSLRLPPGQRAEVVFRVPDRHRVVDLDIWYAEPDRCSFSLAGPVGGPWPLPVGFARLDLAGNSIGTSHHRRNDPNNHRHELLVTLTPEASAGAWQVLVTADDVVDGTVHAWLERAPRHSPQATFDDPDPTSTTGTICHSRRGLAVGALDGDRPAPFSSIGPTLDGRQKPDFAAPGRNVLGARSTPRGAPPGTGGAVRMSGTSMAAPEVAGCVAVLLGVRPELTAAAVRALLGRTARPLPDADPMAVGAGTVDLDRALDVLLKEPAMTVATSWIRTLPPVVDQESWPDEWIGPDEVVALADCAEDVLLDPPEEAEDLMEANTVALPDTPVPDEVDHPAVTLANRLVAAGVGILGCSSLGCYPALAPTARRSPWGFRG